VRNETSQNSRQHRTILVAHFRPDIVSGAEFAIADMLEKSSSHFRYVMLTPGKGPLAEHYRSKGFEVWPQRIETPRRKYPGLHSLQSWFFARRLRAAGVNMAIANTFPAATRVGTACRMAGIPYAIYVREYINDKPLHRFLLARADRIFAVSADVADYLTSMTDPCKIVVAHDHLQAQPLLARIEAAKRGGVAMPFAGDGPLVGIIGRITNYKRQDLFVRAIPWVLKEFPAARFVVVGSAVEKERRYAESLPELARSLGVADRVAFLGHRSDALEIMSCLSVCCLTSDREPFPRTVLEAQLVGCPVVASDTGGCPEMVEDGVTGLFFQANGPDSEKHLAQKIVLLLRDQALHSRLAESARRAVENNFASEQPVKRFECHLEESLYKNSKQGWKG
jgi:glycosyltransferase involved in cell wall biosynthesis